MTGPALLVAPCSGKAAAYAVEHWHYSCRMPAGKLVQFGAWEFGEYVGAVIFGRGVGKYLLAPYGLDVTQGAELVRVALRSHIAPVSQIVSGAVGLLRRSNTGLRLLVSFADPAHGHHGGIYQAMGWTYTGTASPRKVYYDPAEPSRVIHDRHVGSGVAWHFGKISKQRNAADLIAVAQPGKHRYLLPLDRAMRRQISKLAQPYPRGRGVDGDAPVDQTGEAGSTPADRSTITERVSL